MPPNLTSPSTNLTVATVKFVDGEVRLGGIGTYLGDEIYKLTDAETRVTVLGHVQRGAQPTHRDRLIAINLSL